MFMAEAKRLCPELLVVPYEFEKYADISEQVGARYGLWWAVASSQMWVIYQLACSCSCLLEQLLMLAGAAAHACCCSRSCMLGSSQCMHACFITPPHCQPLPGRCTASCCATAAVCSLCPSMRRLWMSPAWVTRRPLPLPCALRYVQRRAAPPVQVRAGLLWSGGAAAHGARRWMVCGCVGAGDMRWLWMLPGLGDTPQPQPLLLPYTPPCCLCV